MSLAIRAYIAIKVKFARLRVRLRNNRPTVWSQNGKGRSDCRFHRSLGDVIDPKTRSIMNITMIRALGKMHEWEVHCKGAISNGVTKHELRAIIHVIGIYCGVPQALECFRAARSALAEAGMED